MKPLRLILLILMMQITAAMADSSVSPLEKMLLDKQYPAFTAAADEAAKKGDAEALFLLGKSYHLGWGVEVDKYKAAEYYEQAATLGSARAFHNIGIIELDDSRPYDAARHLQKALELGLKMPTLTNLGRAHSNIGEDYQKVSELVKATGYLTQAYALEPSDVILKKLIRTSTLAYRFTGEQSSGLREEAIKWLDIGIAKNLPSAYQNYGAILYYEGHVAEAMPWFMKANERNVPEAAYAMGMIYKKGQGDVTKDEAQALYWFKIAAKGGVPEARGVVVDILDHRLNNTYKMTNTELQAAIDDLEVYVEGFVSFNLGSAKNDLLIRRTVEENLQHVQPLPSGGIKFKTCMTDIPGPEGIPLPHVAWRIVVLRKPSDEPLMLEGVVEGETDKHGCLILTPKGSDLLKQSLSAGHTLALVVSSGVSLLMLKQPLHPGKLELVFGPIIEGSE